jgi:intracellular multiplication protein IcmD
MDKVNDRFFEKFFNVGGVRVMHSNMKVSKLNGQWLFKAAIASLLMVATLLFAGNVWAAPGAGSDLGTLALNITESTQNFAKVMMAIAYLAGIAFVLASIFKFKQHKDNPTQIPLGTPLALLVVGIVLVFLPSIFAPAGQTIFGTSEATAVGGFKGEGISKIPGASSSTP